MAKLLLATEVRNKYGFRGYVAAYDSETGERVWKTYTVPCDPSKPFESEAMKKATKTWSGEWGM